MTTPLTTSANEIMSALANGLYQGIALVAIVWVALKVLRGTNASTRYAAFFVTLLVVATLPVAHFILGRNPSAEPAATSAKTAMEHSSADSSNEIVSEQPIEELSARIARLAELEHSLLALLHPADEQPTPETASSSVAVPLRSHWRPAVPDIIPAVLLYSWIGIAAVLLARLACQYVLLRRMKRESGAPAAELQTLFDSLRERALPGRQVRLLVSEELSTPLAAGLAQPTVLLPQDLHDASDAADLEGILLHELAHLRRYDDWTNLVQQILRAVFFFHPAVWWISRRMTVDREIACDDHVLALTQRRQAYALLLTDFAGQRQTQNWTAAPAAWINTNQLKERIGMILDKSRNASPRLARWRTGTIVAGALALAGIAAHIGPRVALASEPEVIKSDDGFILKNGDATLAISDAFSSTPEDLPPVRVEKKIKVNENRYPAARNATATAPGSVAEPTAGLSRDSEFLPVVPAPLPPRPVVPSIAIAAPAPIAIPASKPAPHVKVARSVSVSADVDLDVDRNSLEARISELERMVEKLVEQRVAEMPEGINYSDESRGQVSYHIEERNEEGRDFDYGFHHEFDDDHDHWEHANPFSDEGFSQFFNEDQFQESMQALERELEKSAEAREKMIEDALEFAEKQQQQARKHQREAEERQQFAETRQRNAEESRRRAQRNRSRAQEQIFDTAPLQQERRELELKMRHLEARLEEIEHERKMLHEQIHGLEDKLNHVDGEADLFGKSTKSDKD